MVQPIIINIDDMVQAITNIATWTRSFYSQFAITLSGHQYNLFDVLVAFLALGLIISIFRGAD